MSYQLNTDILLTNGQNSNTSLHKPRKIKQAKRFPGVSKVTKKHYHLELKRSKMLNKRNRSSKRKNWNQKKLFYSKNQQLSEEKVDNQPHEFTPDYNHQQESKLSNQVQKTLIRETKERNKRELLFEIPFRYENQYSSSIKWFDSDNFTKVITRCIEQNVNIYGIEMKDDNGRFLGVICQEEYNNTSSKPWFVDAFNKYSNRMKNKGIRVQYSATYGF